MINDTIELKLKIDQFRSNFLAKDGAIIFNKLRESGVIVRHFERPARIFQYLRITIGTQEEMKKFISILKRII